MKRLLLDERLVLREGSERMVGGHTNLPSRHQAAMYCAG